MREQEKLQLVDLNGFIQMGKMHADHIHTFINFLIFDLVQTSFNSILHTWFIHVTVSFVTEVPNYAKFPFTGKL